MDQPSHTHRFHFLVKICAPALVAVAVSGCIHFDHALLDEPIAPARSLSQHPCCDSPLGQPALQLPANKYVSLVVGREDPVMQFRTGKSFSRMIELPNLEGEYLLQLDSVVYRPHIDLQPKALYPMIVLLDDSLSLVATFDNEPVDLRQPVLGPELVRVILTVPEGSPARYAVLYTSEEKTRLGLTTQSPVELMQKDSFGSMIYTRPTQTRYKIQFETTGMVNVLAYQAQ